MRAMNAAAICVGLVVLVGCKGKADDTKNQSSDDTHNQSSDDTHNQSSDDTAGMGGGPCGESGICNITVENAQLIDCESDSGTVSELSAETAGPGSLNVVHLAASVGCCPEFSASAELEMSEGSIQVEYAFTNDFCDCVCALDVSYTLSGIPTGTWGLRAAGNEIQVSME